jgi:hypothetical protein
MTTTVIPPNKVWTRHHPEAGRIALRLLSHRDLLNLRAGRLVRDVMDVFGVGGCTARIAVAMARRNAHETRRAA